MSTNKKICPLCKRRLGLEENSSKHHLIPISKGGKHTPTILLHHICHQKIHSVFTEKELKRYYYTIERLIEHDELQKFIKWIAKKDVDFYIKTKQKKRK